MRRLKEIFNTKLDASARHRPVRKTKRDYTTKSVACNKPHAAAADVNPSPLSPPVPLPCRGPPRCRCHHEFRGRRFCHTRHTRKTQRLSRHAHGGAQGGAQGAWCAAAAHLPSHLRAQPTALRHVALCCSAQTCTTKKRGVSCVQRQGMLRRGQVNRPTTESQAGTHGTRGRLAGPHLTQSTPARLAS